MVDYQNHYKDIIFKKDLFSNHKITYKKIYNHEVVKIFKKITSLNHENINIFISKNDTATNSVNFIIDKDKKKFFLKKEKKKKEKLVNKISRFQALRKLKKNNYLILPTKKYNKFLETEDSIWSLYKYFDGELFSGKKNQIKLVAKFISKISKLFIKLNINKTGFEYFTSKENNIVNKYIKNFDLLKKTFAKNSEKKFKYFFCEWEKLKKNKKKFNSLKKTFCHFDMHPHNIMIKHNKLKIIDLASIKYMPLEIAIAFSGLKLCRQTIHKNKYKNFKKIGFEFTKSLDKNLRKKLNKNFLISDLASIEIMRRISIILNFNHCGDKSLNYILPTLMSNLIEAKLIFDKSKF
jgi:hypothetical protein